MKKDLFAVLTALFCLLGGPGIQAQSTGVTIVDARHYSHVFAEPRNYRIFLPKGYYQHPEKRYPVIYFLHGWSQRYFGSGDDRYSEFDRGNGKDAENMESFASTHEVIIVKSDGYNRSAGEEYYLRPYNIGPVETFRQFPVYFPELIEHIDASWRTKANRENRAITGLSMGGFMSFVIGGKYPQLFSAVGNFCGSPEFVIGPKDLPVEYRHLDMYRNYGGMKVRLNYGDMDFIRYYHEDLNRVWTQVMDNYEYKIYPGGHTTSGLSEMFGFLFKSFSHPVPKPARWDHTDLYPEFTVWDYTIRTDRIVPGFTILENVDQQGFRCSVREWLPEGELLPFVKVAVTTAAVYEKNQWYTINDIDLESAGVSQQLIRADEKGRLTIPFNGALHEIGINKKTGPPNITIAGYEIAGANWLSPGKETALTLKLVNKGMAEGQGAVLNLSAFTKDLQVLKGQSTLGRIGIQKVLAGQTPFLIKVLSDSIDRVRLKLTIRDRSKKEWVESFEIPVLKEGDETDQFIIADGRELTVAAGGNDSIHSLVGQGNGDGIANPGELVELLVKDQGRYWRTLLNSGDRYINPGGINIRKSDYWGNYDNVGGSMKYSEVLISGDCPADHRIHFLAEYWLPDNPRHLIRRVSLQVPVTGKDNTQPLLLWAKIPGDNLVQAKLYDGSGLKIVVATLTAENKKILQVELNDKGVEGDLVSGDHVFSVVIPEQHFGKYKLVITATDNYGNKLSEGVPGVFVVY